MIEEIARKIWERSHDGSWDDVEGCVSQLTRDIYLDDAKVALEIMASFIERNGCGECDNNLIIAKKLCGGR